MKINILNKIYQVEDTKEKITISDSFVVRANKIGSGNGEAKLYVGQENNETRIFFGGTNFSARCFLLKKDLIKYLEETKIEYLNPEQPYINKDSLPTLWADRKNEVESLPEKIEFEIQEQNQIEGPRVYVKSNELAYKLIRKLSLPNITYISIVKLSNTDNIEYYFRLFADYFGDIKHPYEVRKEIKLLEKVTDLEEKFTQSRARIGQGKYRKNLLQQCPICPITLVSDDRLLIASHIKPWAKSNSQEQLDPHNGFMFTPTFDFLFDRGFMSFTNNKRTILSPFLSKMTYSKLNISNNKTIPHLIMDDKREKYLKYHRANILKG
jgi:predicted restriction endonuclease